MTSNYDPILIQARENRFLRAGHPIFPGYRIEICEEDSPMTFFRENSYRLHYVCLLTSLTTMNANDCRVMLKSLESIDAPHVPSSNSLSLLEKLTKQHGHSLTVTIAAIEAADRADRLDKSIFRSAIEHDPVFWLLLTNFGRAAMPASVADPFTLYEMEKINNAPISNPADYFKVPRLKPKRISNP